jgi:hypothetical protein
MGGVGSGVRQERFKVMIPILLPALEQHGRSRLGQPDRDCVLAISAATIDRVLIDVKSAASATRWPVARKVHCQYLATGLK